MPSIIPSLPTEPSGASLSTSILVDTGESFTVNSGTEYYWTAGMGFRVWGSLANDGLIWAENEFSAIATSVDGPGATFTNSGAVVAIAEAGDASAVSAMNYPTGALSNSGELYALVTSGNAYGIRAERAVESIVNNGLIAAQAFTDPNEPYDPWWPRWAGKAFGVRTAWGDTPVTNGADGQILVEGDWAVGIWSRGGTIDNQGLIHTVSTSAEQPSYGLLLANTTGRFTSIFSSWWRCPANDPGGPDQRRPQRFQRRRPRRHLVAERQRRPQQLARHRRRRVHQQRPQRRRHRPHQLARPARGVHSLGSKPRSLTGIGWRSGR